MDHRIPIKVNVNTNNVSGLGSGSSGLRGGLDSPSSSSDIRDKMQQRMREFEEESRRWREQFMSNSTQVTPQLTDSYHSRPRMFVNFPDFPDLNWPAPSATSTLLGSTSNSLGRSGSGLFGVNSNANSLTSGGGSSSMAAASQNGHKSFIEEDNDGNKRYKLQFDIGDFKPNAIQVRTEGRILIIKGEHEVHVGSATESKQFNREVTLPDFVEPTTVTSYLCDGILTVDAPVLMDRFSGMIGNNNGSATSTLHNSIQNTSTLNSSSNSSRRSPFRDQISPSRTTNGNSLLTTVNTTHSPIASSSTASTIVRNNNNNAYDAQLGSIQNSTATYKFNLSEFRPEDISITVTDTSLKIHAVREEMEPRGKTYREFKRELGLPPNADVKRLKNSLQSDGILLIEIPVQESQQQQQQQRAVQQSSVHQLNNKFNTLSLDQQQQQHLGNVNERVNINDKELKITFDLTGYRPEDVNIKCVSNTLKVHAVHIDNTKGNQIHREYSRSYVLPDWVNVDLLRARMSDNGTLTVEVPLPQMAQPAQLERLIKIQQI